MNVNLSTIEPAVISRWILSPVRYLGGRQNQHWLVKRRSELFVLRHYAKKYADIHYELEVLHRLSELGWPVPMAVEQPIECGESWWCLFSFLPGSNTTKTGLAEQRSRGNLLAELHESMAAMNDLGQRIGFQRSDVIITDPALTEAVRSFESIRPDIGHLMRWHIDQACSHLEKFNLDSIEQIVIHGDFTSWNLLYEGDELSGILDFEFTHLDLRVADFALAWRGKYDHVVYAYNDVHLLSDLDWQLLVPVFWGWLFLGVSEEIRAILNDQRQNHGFDWQVKQLVRRSTLFREMAEPYRR